MDLEIATHQAHSYTVATPVYEGPLDLLLHLIERSELDVTKLAIAQVTDQYLEHLNTLQETAAEEVSAFLVIAAKLLQIKSEVLLPRPPVREEGEEDPGEALARQLKAYKRFKEIGQFLAQREEANLRSYLRLAPSPKVEGTLDLSDMGLEDLVQAAKMILSRADERPTLNTVVSAPRVTIREKIGLIAKSLRKFGKTTFRSLLSSRPSELDVVVTFLAMLELIKRRLVQVNQETLFGEIELESTQDWDENESFELEFGE
jgi:segregation and condensation protein A